MFEQTGQGSSPDVVCLRCHYRGQPDYQVEGSFILELVLWLLFFIPGLIYTISRISGAKPACPSCHGLDVVPSSSPRAKELIDAGKACRGPSGSHGRDYLIRMGVVNGAVALAVWAVIWYIYSI